MIQDHDGQPRGFWRPAELRAIVVSSLRQGSGLSFFEICSYV